MTTEARSAEGPIRKRARIGIVPGRETRLPRGRGRSALMSLVAPIRHHVGVFVARHEVKDVSDFFPPIEHEFRGYEHLLRGRVLNAGAGGRDISHLVEGELVTQDISPAHAPDVVAPLQSSPFPDDHFDAIVCNAVLEHVDEPDAVLTEFARICRPGGTLYLVVPFMQPKHLDPTDYQRYTDDGLTLLVDRHGFHPSEVTGVHPVHSTVGWILLEWFREIPGWRGRVLRATVLPWLRRSAQRNGRHIPAIASAIRVVAVKRPE